MNTSIEYVVHRDPGGRCWAEVLDFPGCVTEADTPEALAFMVRDAVAGCLHVYLDRLRRQTPRRRVSRKFERATVTI